MADTCKACRKPIRFALTAKERRIPLDPEPAANGNLALRTVGKVEYVDVVPVGSQPSLYVSHFATCPDASRFRKKPKGGGGGDDVR